VRSNGAAHAKQHRLVASARCERGARAAAPAAEPGAGRAPEVVKDVGAVPPDIYRPVLAQALVVEAIDLRTARAR